MDIETYARNHPHVASEHLPPLLIQVASQVPAGATVLDAGAGDGSVLGALDARGLLADKTVLARDLSELRVSRLPKFGTRFDAAVDNVETLSTVADESVDFFLSSQVIEHVDDAKMIDAMHRVMRPGAIAYVSTVFKRPGAWYFYRNANGERVLDPTHLREYTGDEQLLRVLQGRFVVEQNVKLPVSYPLFDVALRVVFRSDPHHWAAKKLKRYLDHVRVPVPRFLIWELVLRRVA